VKRIAILAITSACTLLAPVRAGAEERAFISEDLYVFLRRGPSSQFKIVGTLGVGLVLGLLIPRLFIPRRLNSGW
jgi:uncharacterized protein YgiM (DUF1202 family)